MSGIKQFIYDQQMDLEEEIHPRDMESVAEIMANDAHFAHLRMMAEMQPEDCHPNFDPSELMDSPITWLDRLRDWFVALFRPAKRAAEWVTGYEDRDVIPF